MESLPGTEELLKISALSQKVTELFARVSANPPENATQYATYSSAYSRIVGEFSSHVQNYADRYSAKMDALRKEHSALVAATQELQSAARDAKEEKDESKKDREEMMRVLATVQANYEKVSQHLSTSNKASTETAAEIASLRKDLENSGEENKQLKKIIQDLNEQCVTKEFLQSELKELGLTGDTITNTLLSGVEDIIQRTQTHRPQVPLRGTIRSGRPIPDPAVAGLLNSQLRGPGAGGGFDDGEELRERLGAVHVDDAPRLLPSRRNSTSTTFQDGAGLPPFGPLTSADTRSGHPLGSTSTRQPLVHSRPPTSEGPPRVQKKRTTDRVGQDVGEVAFAEGAGSGQGASAVQGAAVGGGAAAGEEVAAGESSEPVTAGLPTPTGGFDDMEGKPLRINISSAARIKNSVLNENMKAKLVQDSERYADHVVRLAKRIKEGRLCCWHVHGISNTSISNFPTWSRADFDNDEKCSACLKDPTRQCFKITEDSLGFKVPSRPVRGLLDGSSGFLLAATAQQHREQAQKDMENDGDELYR